MYFSPVHTAIRNPNYLIIKWLGFFLFRFCEHFVNISKKVCQNLHFDTQLKYKTNRTGLYSKDRFFLYYTQQELIILILI